MSTGKATTRTSWRWPLIGALVAIAASAVMDAIGISNFNALPLILLFFLFWYLQHLSRADIGLAWGHRRDYALGVLYPAVLAAVLWVVYTRGRAVPVAPAQSTR